ncbi:MAG: RING-HC finger protein [Clostridiales bacterium]|nr:RING-HC finger protein [Clostridiales bacterium]
MSYCVECGVRLAASEPKCPLCQTPVVNPNRPVCQLEDTSHPQAIEEAISRMDRGYARQLSLIFLMIPILAVLIIDLIDSGGSWSPYVVGALVMSYCFFAFPLLFRFTRPYVYIVVDVLALLGFLLLIAWRGDGLSWYLSLVLPLLILLGVATLLIILVLRRQELKRLYRAALAMGLFAAALLGLEIIIDLNAWGQFHLGWSVYAAIPLAVIALMLAGLEQNRELKEAVRKRLFL